MRKKLLLLCLVFSMMGSVLGCGPYVRPTYNNMYAIIRLPNGEIIEGRVEDRKRIDDYWKVVIDGVTYQTHLNNIAFIGKEEE